jgi:hypothetical protein
MIYHHIKKNIVIYILTMEYNTFNNSFATSTVLTGVRHGEKNKYKKSKIVYITGFYNVGQVQVGFIYRGDPVNSQKGTFYPISFPGSYSTTPYGPDRIDDCNVNVVGNYVLSSNGNAMGFLYTGPYLDTDRGTFVTIVPPFPNATNTIVHSVMNGVAVGNYAPALSQLTLSPMGNAISAFIFNSCNNKYCKIDIECASSVTAYGIWHNSDSQYTIAGGYTLNGKNRGYIVDWNSDTETFNNFTSYKYGNSDSSLITHFDGITGVGNNVYHLTGDFIVVGALPGAFYAVIDRCEKSCDAKWAQILYPQSNFTSGNTVIDNKVYGIYVLNDTVNGYECSISNCAVEPICETICETGCGNKHGRYD